MTKFKVGDKVVRTAGAKSTFWDWLPRREYYTVTAVSQQGYWIQVDGVRVQPDDPVPWRADGFNLYEELPTPEAGTPSTSWDPNVAAIMRQEAERCVKQYNDYIKLQPKQLQPITIK
ncbi:hypothetical protein KMI5_21 [Klebsiella phage KMI5]|uniref:Uncharacterized protein n=1 Tax=Klebsiella phage KMI3 TaxID=2601614 RepID=A0A5B9NEU8_9CAUD|nr:hypothetical protein KMI3_14 [Klebsiella phage KMI3]QEG10080.1 hypothetical protein KMI5_21 [Klebsiella phage KMI5]